MAFLLSGFDDQKRRSPYDLSGGAIHMQMVVRRRSRQVKRAAPQLTVALRVA